MMQDIATSLGPEALMVAIKTAFGIHFYIICFNKV